MGAPRPPSTLLLLLLLPPPCAIPRVAAAMPPVPPPGQCGVGEDHHTDGWGSVSVACPPGQAIAEVIFASWGSWVAKCDGFVIDQPSREDQDCSGDGCNGGASCACPPAGFAKAGTAACPTCEWGEGPAVGPTSDWNKHEPCSDKGAAMRYVSHHCVGKSSCGPFPASNGNPFGGDPCSGVSKHLGIAVKCCPHGGCPSSWGGGFLTMLCVVVLGYAALSLAHGYHRGLRGRELLHRHPHRALWAEVAALVMDGVAFARGSSSRRGGAGRQPLQPQPQAGSLPGSSPALDSSGRNRKSDGGRRKAKKQGKRGHGGGGRGVDSLPAESGGHQPHSGTGVAVTQQPPTGSPAPSVAAGGGGRWVRVPT
jgi:hypothetical protein